MQFLETVSIMIRHRLHREDLITIMNWRIARSQMGYYNFLCDSYVVLLQNIKGKDYLFVHAMPPKDSQMINNMKQSRKRYRFKELTREQYGFMLQ